MKEETIHIRVVPELKEKVLADAAKAGLKLSDYIRAVLQNQSQVDTGISDEVMAEVCDTFEQVVADYRNLLEEVRGFQQNIIALEKNCGTTPADDDVDYASIGNCWHIP
jgi:phosphopantetheine adenylyltransferase